MHDFRRLGRFVLSRLHIELLTFVRTPDALFFTFLLPVLFVLVFSMIFRWDIEGPPGSEPVSFPQYFVPGMIAAGVMSVTFVYIATAVAAEQHDGLLRRLSATPLPRAAYFGGKVGLAFITSVLIVLVILALGALAFGVRLPTEPEKWGVLAAVVFLGAGSCTLLGLAYTRLIGSSGSAAAVVQPPYIVLQFISGVFIQYSMVPDWLQAVASIFPLRWMAQATRSVFLPEWVAYSEYGGGWDVGTSFAVLLAWFVAAAVLARLAFRWDRGAG
mgnify:FL=1